MNGRLIQKNDFRILLQIENGQMKIKKDYKISPITWHALSHYSEDNKGIPVRVSPLNDRTIVVEIEGTSFGSFKIDDEQLAKILQKPATSVAVHGG